MNFFDVLSLLGGLAMFLYGIRLMGDSLKENFSGTLNTERCWSKRTGNTLTGAMPRKAPRITSSLKSLWMIRQARPCRIRFHEHLKTQSVFCMQADKSGK